MGSQVSTPSAVDTSAEVPHEYNAEAGEGDKSMNDSFNVTISDELANEIISSLQSAGQDADSGEANFNEERRKNYEEKLDSWRKWNEGRQTELDDAIDGLNAKLQDLMLEFQHEADMLNKSWENPKYGDKVACLDLRASLSSCLIDGKGIECGVFVKALERCASKAVTSAQ